MPEVDEQHQAKMCLKTCTQQSACASGPSLSAHDGRHIYASASLFERDVQGEELYKKGEELYKRSAFVLIPFVLYTILYVCMLQFTK